MRVETHQAPDKQNYLQNPPNEQPHEYPPNAQDELHPTQRKIIDITRPSQPLQNEITTQRKPTSL